MQVLVVGLGYVGLPLAETFAFRDTRLSALDIDPLKVARLNRGESYIGHICPERVEELLASGRFEATDDAGRFRDADAIIICVPTPLTEAREPDLSYIENTGRALCQFLRPGQLVVLESTTYPGTTEDGKRPILEESGLKCGRDFFLAYSPEREDPGNRDFATRNIPKVVGGCDPASQRLAVALYEPVVEGVVPVSSTRVAEACKILENTYRAVNIALVNELKVVFDRMDIDVWEVIAAAKTKPFGFQAFYPGPGLGGHCIPIDPFYLTWAARKYGVHTRFIELAGEVNTAMPQYVIEPRGRGGERGRQTGQGKPRLYPGCRLQEGCGRSARVAGVHHYGVVAEARLTPVVIYNDPHIPTLPTMRNRTASAWTANPSRPSFSRPRIVC